MERRDRILSSFSLTLKPEISPTTCRLNIAIINNYTCTLVLIYSFILNVYLIKWIITIYLLPCMDCNRHNITFHNCLEDFAPSFSSPSPSPPPPFPSPPLSFPPPYLGRSASSLTMLFFSSTLNPVGSRI